MCEQQAGADPAFFVFKQTHLAALGRVRSRQARIDAPAGADKCSPGVAPAGSAQAYSGRITGPGSGSPAGLAPLRPARAARSRRDGQHAVPLGCFRGGFSLAGLRPIKEGLCSVRPVPSAWCRAARLPALSGVARAGALSPLRAAGVRFSSRLVWRPAAAGRFLAGPVPSAAGAFGFSWARVPPGFAPPPGFRAVRLWPLALGFSRALCRLGSAPLGLCLLPGAKKGGRFRPPLCRCPLTWCGNRCPRAASCCRCSPLRR